MRIISDFKDYYDCAATMVDTSLVYHRDNKEELVRYNPYTDGTEHYDGWMSDKWLSAYDPSISHTSVIGFCGKLWYGNYSTTEIWKPYTVVNSWTNLLKTKFDEVPIFKMVKHTWDRRLVIHKNCSLREHDFAKVLDPYTAYQELEMWIGSLKNTEIDNPVGISSEKLRLEKIGFNHKSFKKTEDHRKRKQKNGKIHKKGV